MCILHHEEIYPIPGAHQDQTTISHTWNPRVVLLGRGQVVGCDPEYQWKGTVRRAEIIRQVRRGPVPAPRTRLTAVVALANGSRKVVSPKLTILPSGAGDSRHLTIVRLKAAKEAAKGVGGGVGDCERGVIVGVILCCP